MAKYNQEELTLLQRRLEAESARIQEEKRQLQEQQAQVIRESEKITESQRQLQEELRRVQQQRTTAETSSSKVQGVKGTIIDVDKFSMTDDFELWFEQFEEFIIVNGVTPETAVSLFIMKIGAEGYRLLRNLCAPELPRDKNLSELASLIQNHLKPKPNALTQRYKFKECKQRLGETVSAYLAKLKQISLHCDFGSNLHISLRDQLVWGLANERMKKRLLTEPNLTLEKAVELCAAMETAEKDVADMGSEQQNNSRGAAINYFAKKTGAFYKPPYKGPKESWNCFCCGKPNHKINNCRFKDYNCNICKRKGHLASVCRNKRSNVEINVKQANFKSNSKPFKREQQQFISEEEEDLSTAFRTLYHLDDRRETDTNKPITVRLIVQNTPMLFEIDSGSPISAISWGKFKEYKELSRLKIFSTPRVFKSYSGSPIVPKGVLKVNVRFQSKQALLNLFILPGNSRPIIGREWLAILNILKIRDHSLNVDINNLSENQEDSVRDIIAKYRSVFTEELGMCTTHTFKLVLKDNAKPVCCKPRPVPFAMRERVENEIARLIDIGILEQVESSEWATPIVPVLKSNGQIRMCGDYKITLNPHLEINKYPIPRVTDLLSQLEKGTIFSKIDLAHAYQQVRLDEASKDLTTIATHKGLYRFNRLCFGVASAPGLFQNLMETILRGLNGVIVYFDDILIFGETLEEHNANLERTLERLKENGLTVSLKKCFFARNKVQFLGFELDKSGIHVSPEKSRAILQMHKPTNVTELKSFLGMINYYSKFIPNYATVASPLYALLRKDVQFNWSSKCHYAFEQIKKLIASNKVLVHYSSNLPLKLTCDASPVGLGAVLSHVYPRGEEKPIAFASRTLTATERQYSQLDKEALALIFAVKYFHQFIYGRKFELETDHKPLIYIFGPKKGIPQMAATRVQRWAVFLAAYDFQIKYIKGINNAVADSLSRITANIRDNSRMFEDYSFLNYVMEEMQSIDSFEINNETGKDPILRIVRKFIMEGWPNKVPDNVQCYKKYAFELSVENGCIMWGHRVIIPQALRNRLLNELHDTHWGTVKMKMIARSYFWWPKLDADIERITKSCSLCLENADNPPRATLQPWKWPSAPNQRLHADFCGPIAGHMYLIIVDSFSKWIDIKEMPDITAESTIRACREYFGIWGIPLTLVTDNGPTFTSEKFAIFLEKNGVKHIRTAPYHPASNGEAENAVRTFKAKFKLLLNKMSRAEALIKYLFANRSTAHVTTGVSPAELQFNRKMRTRFDLLKPTIRNRVELNQARQRLYFRGNRNASFNEDENVVAKDYSNNTWRDAKIIERCSPVTYTVRTDDNRLWKRHVDQIRVNLKENNMNEEDNVYENVERDQTPARIVSTQRESNESVVITEEAASSVSDNIPLSSKHSASPKPSAKAEVSSNKERGGITPRRSTRIRKPRKILDL